ncbi:transcriptional regulator Myc-A-like [Bombina bombina]|uniref:transcriptional regulator Myc-A-like n=1 Tax=Bombina bombina TaxID=8345 RepID=UPI00235B0867|nr:transcriptional regulator Myc-A-like [Bombina bombina]
MALDSSSQSQNYDYDSMKPYFYFEEEQQQHSKLQPPAPSEDIWKKFELFTTPPVSPSHMSSLSSLVSSSEDQLEMVTEFLGGDIVNPSFIHGPDDETSVKSIIIQDCMWSGFSAAAAKSEKAVSEKLPSYQLSRKEGSLSSHNQPQQQILQKTCSGHESPVRSSHSYLQDPSSGCIAPSVVFPCPVSATISKANPTHLVKDLTMDTPPISSDRNSITPPFSSDRNSSTPPISSDRNSSTPSISSDRNSSTPPISSDRNSSTPPISSDRNSSTPLISSDINSSTPPISSNINSSTPPISSDRNSSDSEQDDEPDHDEGKEETDVVTLEKRQLASKKAELSSCSQRSQPHRNSALKRCHVCNDHHNYTAPPSTKADCPSSKRTRLESKTSVLDQVSNHSKCTSPRTPGQKRSHNARLESNTRVLDQMSNHSKCTSPRTPGQKTSHNVLERQRRKELRLSFIALRDQIPEIANNKKASTHVILKKATEYVLSMREDQRWLSREVDELRIRNKQLKEKLNQLRKFSF